MCRWIKIKPYAIFAFLLIFAASFLGGKTAFARDPQPATDAQTLIAEVNALRVNNGLQPYTVNATLMAVAQAHTEYQAAMGTVTHYGADGSRPYQRALAAGYPVGGNLDAGGYFSENITAGYQRTPAEAVLSWQGDAPHLNTMLSPYLTEVGAGVVDVDGYIYYTLDASTPSNGVVSVTNTPDLNVTPDGTETVDDSGALPTLDWIMPVITSTPDGAGKIVHEVQVGQSLWGIADVYGTTVQEIRDLNYMSVEELVYPGELLFIRQAPTPLPSTPRVAATPSTAPTLPLLTETSLPTRETEGPPPTDAAVTEIPSASEAIVDSSIWTVLVIIFAALLMAGLATWLSGRERD